MAWYLYVPVVQDVHSLSSDILLCSAVPSQGEASEGSSSVFTYRPSSGQISPPPEVFKPSLPTVAEGSSVTHLDPEVVDIPDPLDLSPPLGSVPMLPGLRGIQRPAMRPSKPRSAGPGRGPVAVPSTTHPEARPYGVARSSLALREQAQLHAEQPGALLMPPRHKSASSDKCPEKLPTPEAAVNLLAQVHAAEKRFETTLPNGKPPTPTVTAAAVLGADAVDQTIVAKFVKETTPAPQKPARPAPTASKSAAQGATPQAGSASPQTALHATVAEPPVAAAATTVSEPAAADAAAAPVARKSKKVKAAGTQPNSSVAQPQAQPPAASQPAGLPNQSPSEARAEQSAVPAATQPALKDQSAPVPAAAVASASAAPTAAVPSASSATATASSAVQPEAPLVKTEAATEGSLIPPDADPGSPTGEQASASKQGKQRMGKKQREKQRQEAAAKAVVDARIKAEQDAEQAAKDAAQAAKDAARAAKDAEYAEKRRIIQEKVDKAKREESQAAAALAAAKDIEDAANAAKQAASEVEDAAAQGISLCAQALSSQTAFQLLMYFCCQVSPQLLACLASLHSMVDIHAFVCFFGLCLTNIVHQFIK